MPHDHTDPYLALHDPDDAAAWHHAGEAVDAILAALRRNRDRAASGDKPLPCQLTPDQAAGLAVMIGQMSAALHVRPFYL